MPSVEISTENKVFYAYVGMLLVILFCFFSSLFFNDFGYHNDYEIFTYKKEKHFPEYEWLIVIGRYLGAVLADFQVSFIEDIRDLKYVRLVSFAFVAGTYLMLVAFFKGRTTNPYYLALIFPLCFATTSFQLNLGWVLCSVPVIFNAFVFCALSLWYSVSVRKKPWLANSLALPAIIAGMYIYPPTTFFFLVFLFCDYYFSNDAKPLNHALILVLLAMPLYYVLHKLTLNLFIIPNFEDTYNALLKKPRYDMSFSIFDIDIKEKLKVMLSLINFSMNLFYGYSISSVAWKIQEIIKYGAYFIFMLHVCIAIYRQEMQKVRVFLYFCALVILFTAPFLVSKSGSVLLYRAVGASQFLMVFYLFHVLRELSKMASVLKALSALLVVLSVSIGFMNLNSIARYAINEYESTKKQFMRKLFIDDGETVLTVVTGKKFEYENDMHLGAYLNPSFEGLYFGIQKEIGYLKYKQIIFVDDYKNVGNLDSYIDMTILNDARRTELEEYVKASQTGRFDAVYESGFFAEEENEFETWNWSKKKCTFKVLNRTGNYTDTAAEFSIDISSAKSEASDVDVFLNEAFLKTVAVDRNIRNEKIRLHFAPGYNYIEFVAKEELKYLTESDRRGIYLRFSDLKIEEIDE